MRSQILHKVKQTVQQIEQDARIVLFGSRARDEHNKESDWDFLVIVSGNVTVEREDRIRHALYEIEWETGEVISTIIKSKEVWSAPEYQQVPLHKAIEREGITL
jgi:predicted nucleotidyltransferase